MKHKIMRLTVIALLIAAHTTTFIRPAAAEVVQNTRETFPLYYYDDCTGEWIEGTFDVHTIWIINTGKLDSIHQNLNGTGVGQITGNRYVINQNYKDDFSNIVCGGTVTGRYKVRAISLGKAPNQLLDISVTWQIDNACNIQFPTYDVVAKCTK